MTKNIRTWKFSKILLALIKYTFSCKQPAQVFLSPYRRKSCSIIIIMKNFSLAFYWFLLMSPLRQKLLSVCWYVDGISQNLQNFFINQVPSRCFPSYGVLITSQIIKSVDISELVGTNQSISVNEFYPIEALNLIRAFFIFP